MTSDTIDYFMSQPNGANYVVLYQMLCLKTINTGGRLSRQIGEIIIPYDVEKIQRDCKWFSSDTVRVALKLYQAVGLVYEDVDGTLVLADHKNLVGSETDAAARMRSSRENRALPPPEGVTQGEQSANNVTPEIDIRDEILEIDIREEEKEGESESPAPPNPPPPQPEEEGKPVRHKYGEYKNVLLSDEDLAKLQKEIPSWKSYIERLSSYMASSGKRYKNHLATIRNWARADKEKERAKRGSQGYDDNDLDFIPN